MKISLSKGISLFWLFWSAFFVAEAQTATRSARTTAESPEVTGQTDILLFKELERRTYFRKERRLARISALQRSGKDARAYRQLRSYVSHFAIPNFRLDGPLLMEWVRLADKYGPPGESRLAARILMKHQPAGLDSLEVLRLYDRIETEKPKFFLSIREYYRLVLPETGGSVRDPAIVTNVGAAINSPAEDYAPTFGNTDNLLLFTSKRNRHQTDLTAPPDEDLFISRRVKGQWQPARELRLINTYLNEGSACLSRDGKTLFFSRCDAPRSYGSCDLYVAHLAKDSVWKDITNLGHNINSGGWESHPSLTRSGDTLFFASNRAGGFGMSDIYFSVRDRNGKWGKARNAGPLINTRYMEVSPFVHHRFNVLYFSSNGHPVRFGDFDIYRSDIRSRGLSEPENIGPLINSAGKEYYYSMDSNSGEILFTRATSLTDETLDIYTFPLPMEAQPQANTWLTGRVADSLGMPLTGIIRVIDVEGAVETAPRYLAGDGYFRFRLLNGRKYRLILFSDRLGRREQDLLLMGDKFVEWTVGR